MRALKYKTLGANLAYYNSAYTVTWMVNNAEIVQCESQVKISVKWNSSFVKMTFWSVHAVII